MITHVVLFRPKPDLPAEQRRAVLDALRSALHAIPAIAAARFGPRVLVGRAYESLMTTDYEFAAMIDFENLEGLRAYLDHPVHASLASAFFVSAQDALMYDFDMGEGLAGLERLAVE